MRWLIAPDSFKGSLAAAEVAAAMATGVRRADPDAVVMLKPMADGGEGTLDAVYAAIGGQWCARVVQDAGGRPRKAAYLRLPDGSALIEVAQVVPLSDAPGVPVLERSSFGVGELMRDALEQGATRLALALGGSSTNDGGTGLLAALGVRFLDAKGRMLAPCPNGLLAVAGIDASALHPCLAGVGIEVWSDVDNPLVGERGASAVFGPQKGLQAADVFELDALLARVAMLAGAETLARLPGAGAAGGMGWALSWLGGRRLPGAGALAAHTGLYPALASTDWVLTGEGASDVQTLSGKAPFAVAQWARAAGVPVSLVSGALRPDAAGQLAAAFDGCVSLCSGPMTLAEAMAQTPALLAQACEQLVRTILRARGLPAR
ncbi:glycerate kinase [Craterilacuibacter sp.]|uniref:glycerate kinase n=1 Tax=Craterilacuibacter sp. TaxID=2870909 RepID=UPI003F2A2CBB